MLLWNEVIGNVQLLTKGRKGVYCKKLTWDFGFVARIGPLRPIQPDCGPDLSVDRDITEVLTTLGQVCGRIEAGEGVKLLNEMRLIVITTLRRY